MLQHTPEYRTSETAQLSRMKPWNTFVRRSSQRAGKVKYALLGWLIGLPLPIILILLFFRGCDF